MALALGPFDKWFSGTKLSLELVGRASAGSAGASPSRTKVAWPQEAVDWMLGWMLAWMFSA